jgi:hypothetical protein
MSAREEVADFLIVEHWPIANAYGRRVAYNS